jgi:hypothetical protein
VTAPQQVKVAGQLTGSVHDASHLANDSDDGALNARRSRGLGIVRYDLGTVAFGHTGGMAGFSTTAMRTPAGRCVILWQNGYDVHDPQIWNGCSSFGVKAGTGE